MPARCRDEESMSDLSSLPPHTINKPFQQLHLECLINSGTFGQKIEVDDTADVVNADQYCFDLGI
jgi:hypothetical protein